MKKIQSLLLTAALFGCDTTTSPGQDMTPVVVTPEQACPDLIKAYCAKAAECFPFNQGLVWPDAATCAARLNLSCPQLAKLTGSSVTGADLMACTPKFASLSCTDYFSQTSQIQVCGFKPGTLADGTACGEDVQCQSLYCKKDAGMDCGKCTVLGKSGSVCVSGLDCDKGLACVGAAGAKQCTPFLMTGATCSTASNSVPCHPTLACRNGMCGPQAQLGDTCSQAAQDCDKQKGLFCPATLKCVALTTATLGSPCGQQGSTFILCNGGTSCDSVTKKCIAPLADNATCSTTAGASCQTPAKCAANVCKIPDPTLCK